MEVENNPTFIETLRAFLREETPIYKEKTLKVLNSDPLQLTSDGVHFIEALSFQRQLLMSSTGLQAGDYIQIKRWNFVQNKVPGNDDVYIDLQISEYENLHKNGSLEDESEI